MFPQTGSEDFDQTRRMPPGDAQTDLSLRLAQMSFCWFCHEDAQLFRNCAR